MVKWLFYSLLLTMLVCSCKSATDANAAGNDSAVVVGKKESRLSTDEARKQAMALFHEYSPIIMETNAGVMDMVEAHTGDFTADGVPDVAIYFALSPKDGGNALVAQGLALYKMGSDSVTVMAGYEPDYLFAFDTIKNGSIYIQKLAYAEGDGHCCPSIKEIKKLTIQGNKVF